MKFSFLLIALFLCKCGLSNVSVVYEEDEGNLHIRYNDGGNKNRKFEMQVLFDLLKAAEKQNHFPVPVLVSCYEHEVRRDSNTYHLGYGTIKFIQYPDTVRTKGISLYVNGMNLDNPKIMQLLFYAVQHPDEISGLSQKTSLKRWFPDKVENINAIPAGDVLQIFHKKSEVPVNLWAQRIDISNDYDGRIKSSSVRLYFQHATYYFYYKDTDSMDQPYAGKEKVLFTTPVLFKYDADDNFGCLVFTSYNTLYYFNKWQDSAGGPFIIHDVSPYPLPVNFIGYSHPPYEPYEMIEFSIDGKKGNNTLLLVPEKKLLIEHYDSFQLRLIDSLSAPIKNTTVSKAPNIIKPLLFWGIVITLILLGIVIFYRNSFKA